MEFPHSFRTIEQDTPRRSKRQKTLNDSSRQDEIDPENESRLGKMKAGPEQFK